MTTGQFFPGGGTGTGTGGSGAEEVDVGLVEPIDPGILIWIDEGTSPLPGGEGTGLDIEAADARYIQATGGTMTGELGLEEGAWTDKAPTDAYHIINKNYVDSRTPKIIVLGPADPVPGGTPAGTVIVRTES